VCLLVFGRGEGPGWRARLGKPSGFFFGRGSSEGNQDRIHCFWPQPVRPSSKPWGEVCLLACEETATAGDSWAPSPEGQSQGGRPGQGGREFKRRRGRGITGRTARRRSCFPRLAAGSTGIEVFLGGGLLSGSGRKSPWRLLPMAEPRSRAERYLGR